VRWIKPTESCPVGCKRSGATKGWLITTEVQCCCPTSAGSYCEQGQEVKFTMKSCSSLNPQCIYKTFTVANGNACCCPLGVIPALAPGCGNPCSGPNDQTCPKECKCLHTSGKTGNWICGGDNALVAPHCDVCGCKVDNFDCPRECNEDCRKCVTPDKNYKGGAWTALGCIPTGDFSEFTAWLLKRIIAVAGGIAFLLVIFGGFRIITSAGDPKGVQAAKETITSALIGLLFIIFSVFLLELIGVKILGIPGL